MLFVRLTRQIPEKQMLLQKSLSYDQFTLRLIFISIPSFLCLYFGILSSFEIIGSFWNDGNPSMWIDSFESNLVCEHISESFWFFVNQKLSVVGGGKKSFIKIGSKDFDQIYSNTTYKK